MSVDSSRITSRQYTWIAAVAGVAATVAQRRIRSVLSRAAEHGPGPRQVVQRITVGGRPADVSSTRPPFGELPRIVPFLRSAEVGESGLVELVADLPGGDTGRWAVRIVEWRGAEWARWELVDLARHDDSDTISGFFACGPAPAGRGTELTLALEHGSNLLEQAAGEVAEKVLRETLRRFKQWFETGEVATSDGQSSARSPARERPELRAVAQRCLDDKRRRTRIVDNAVEESFPASDPPAFGRGI